ncbi:MULTISPECIES: DNA primase family protein [Pelosinus]|nr:MULTISPECIES: DNA primase family protein [Pelosinus]
MASSNAKASIDMNTKQFLEALYSNAEGYISLWGKSTKKTCFIDVSNIDTIIDTAMSVKNDIYFGVNLGSKPKSEGRFTAEDITTIPALYVDIDIAGPNHKSKNLPADMNQALTFINELPIEPSIIVSSGSGLHCYYIFKEPWKLEPPEERLQAQSISKGWQNYIRSRTKWNIDSTYDLPRVLRIPGTFNCKNPEIPVEVTVLSSNDNRYNQSDFSQYIAEVVKVEKRDRFKRNPSDGPAKLAIDNCKFLQACRDHAAELSESQWVAMITNVARCSDGPEIVHELSKSYPGYTEQETTNKIYHCLNDMQAQTCGYIQESLGFKMCPDGGCGVKAPCSWALSTNKVRRTNDGTKLEAIEDFDKPVPDGFFDADIPPKEFFDGSGKFVPPQLAEYIMATNTLAYDHGSLFIYQNGVYIPIDFTKIKQICIDLLGKDYRDSRGTEVARYIQTSKLSDENFFEGATEFLNVKNGLVNFRDHEIKLLPHTSDYHSEIQIPVVYDKNAKCPNILKFFNDVLPNGCQEFIEELFGYFLVTSTVIQKAFLLYSGGESGKSIFLDLVGRFVGDNNTSHESLQDLSENKFRKASLVGKLVNVFADIPSRSIEDSSIFKTLTGGDWITAEKKGEKPFKFRNTAKLIFSCNELPRSKDHSHGFFRRWIVITFPNQFPPGSPQRDPFIINKITTAEELSGLLNLSINGLRRLFKRGHFLEPEILAQNLEKYKLSNDSVSLFLAECCEEKTGNIETKSFIYNRYSDFCKCNGLHPVSSIKFNKKLLEVFPNAKEYRTKETRNWLNIVVIN